MLGAWRAISFKAERSEQCQSGDDLGSSYCPTEADTQCQSGWISPKILGLGPALLIRKGSPMGCSRFLAATAMSMNTCFCSPNPGLSFGSVETERGKEGRRERVVTHSQTLQWSPVEEIRLTLRELNT